MVIMDKQTLKVLLSRYKDYYNYLRCLYDVKYKRPDLSDIVDSSLEDVPFKYIYYMDYTMGLINLLDNVEYRTVLIYHFVEFKCFEKIADLMFISVRQVYRLYDRAICELLDILNKNDNS